MFKKFDSTLKSRHKKPRTDEMVKKGHRLPLPTQDELRTTSLFVKSLKMAALRVWRLETAWAVRLQQISDVHGHLLDGGVVELLDVVQRADVIGGDKVDGDTLSAKTTAAPNPEKQNNYNCIDL